MFLFEGDILWDGIRWCYRLESAPLRPAYDVYPVIMTEEEDIINAVRPIAHLTFSFGTAEDLENARRHITELVYPVMR